MDVQFDSVTGLPYGSTDFLNNLGTNPIVLLILVVIIVIYYFIFASLGNSKTTTSGMGKGAIVFLEVLLWGIFIVLILLNGMSYFFNINIVASIKDLFSDIPQINILSKGDLGDGDFIDGDGSTSVPELKFTKQVFNIPGNYYDYDNAKALCKAYGGRLAKYKEIEKAYEEGADWCNYGWSDNQMALFPTSMKKWKKLQKIPGHKHDCGRPGINGGYIANPNVQFGVNCYGYKPKMTNLEQQLMNNAPLYPRTKKELFFDQKVNLLKEQLPNILVSPFNNDSWSINLLQKIEEKL